jgi:hypothetical protein
MFSRTITMRLKPNNVFQLTKVMEERVLPLLRKQEGFKEEMFFLSPNGMDAIGISLWDRQESAESYHKNAYPQVIESMSNLLEGNPQVKTYDVVSSTFDKVAPRVTV